MQIGAAIHRSTVVGNGEPLLTEIADQLRADVRLSDAIGLHVSQVLLQDHATGLQLFILKALQPAAQLLQVTDNLLPAARPALNLLGT